jgi:hypothetical protein
MKRFLLASLFLAGTVLAQTPPAPQEPMNPALRNRMAAASPSESTPTAPVDAGPPIDLGSASDGGSYDVPRHLMASAMVPPGNWVISDPTLRQVAADKKTCEAARTAQTGGPATPIGYVLVGTGGLLLGAAAVALYFLSRPADPAKK